MVRVLSFVLFLEGRMISFFCAVSKKIVIDLETIKIDTIFVLSEKKRIWNLFITKTRGKSRT